MYGIKVQTIWKIGFRFAGRYITTTGEDVFLIMDSFFEEHGLLWKQCYSACCDHAPAISKARRGAEALRGQNFRKATLTRGRDFHRKCLFAMIYIQQFHLNCAACPVFVDLCSWHFRSMLIFPKTDICICCNNCTVTQYT